MNVAYKGKGLKVLSFDIECRPLSYLGSDFTTAEITGIAAAWIVNGKARGMKCWLLGETEPWDILESFRAMYDLADIVTGHYIRNFDLPVINGSMLDNGLPPLSSKMTSDTKNDLKKRKYISASQENLSAAIGVRAPKVSMNQQLWREANRLTPDGLALTRKRVTGDVKQQAQMRERLLQMGWLGGPKLWHSGAPAATGAYQA